MPLHRGAAHRVDPRCQAGAATPAPAGLLIGDDRLLVQLQEVLAYVGEQVDPKRLLSRCVECNDRIRIVNKEAVRDRVPAYVFETQSPFSSCPTCRRVYWAGTHRDHILERLAPLLPGSV